MKIKSGRLASTADVSGSKISKKELKLQKGAKETLEGVESPLQRLRNFYLLPLHLPTLAEYAPPSSSSTTLTTATPLVQVKGGAKKQQSKSQEEEPVQYLFFCENTTRKVDESLPSGRTLFLLNLPAHCHSAHLEAIFTPECGPIERVVLPRTEGPLVSVSRGYIVFASSEGVKRALAMRSVPRYWPTDVGITKPSDNTTGLSRWLHRQSLTTPTWSDLQRQVDAHLASFESIEAERRAALAQAHNVPDEDGFITVTRGGVGSRRNVHRDGDATVMAVDPAAVRPVKDYTKVDFYRFQMRESKRQQLADLRRKFEQDKERIASLKASRKFRPY